MVRAIVLLAIVAIIVIAAGVWAAITWRHRVARRTERRYDELSDTLSKVDAELAKYSPVDGVGQELERQIREVFVSYYAVLRIADRTARWLDAAETAHSKLAQLITQHPQSLFAPTDDVSKAFVREVFGILHPTEKKEIPHVP